MDVAALTIVEEVMVSNLGPNRVVANEVKSWIPIDPMSDASGMTWLKIGATYYHAQLVLTDKGLFVCNIYKNEHWNVEKK